MPIDPPGALHTEIRHDGIVCRTRRSAPTAAGALLLPLLFLLVCVYGLMQVGMPLSWLAGIVPLVVLVSAVFWPARWRLTVNDRWVEVVRDRSYSREAWRFPLEELERWYVAVPTEDYGGHFLVLRGKHDTVKVAEGRPVEELQWMKAAIDEAMDTRRRRESVEGREWSFQKKAPEDIQVLVERK